MTTFYLVRHGRNDFLPHTLVGRKPGVSLNDEGRAEADRVAAQLASEGIQMIYSSPMERCRETAAPLAAKLKLEVNIAEGLNEVNFGDWTGRKIAELERIEQWKQWDRCRGGGRIPNGETMLEAQARVVAFVQKLAADFPDHRIALFSHADPLRAVLLYFLGIPCEFIQRLEMHPASISVLTLSPGEARVRCVNMPARDS